MTGSGGYPVRRSLSIPSLMSRNTGSSAFAGDDGRGNMARSQFATGSIFKQPKTFSCRRHCERSEAIHRRHGKKDGLLRGACHRARIRATRWLAMTWNCRRYFTTSPRNAPESLLDLPPKEGVGNAGCPLHPRPRVHLVVVERTRVTTSTPESPDVPARNGFNGFLRALVTGLFCHRHPRIW